MHLETTGAAQLLIPNTLGTVMFQERVILTANIFGDISVA
jgi:hypothetical protein